MLSNMAYVKEMDPSANRNNPGGIKEEERDAPSPNVPEGAECDVTQIAI